MLHDTLCPASFRDGSLLWNCLNGGLDWWFVSFWSLDWDTFGGGSGGGWFCRLSAISVEFQQLRQIETRLLQHLHLEREGDGSVPQHFHFKNSPTYFTDVNIVQWVDSVARLLDILGDGVGQQLVDDFLQVRGRHVANDDVGHLLADGLDLRGLSVAGFAMGRSVLLGESKAENAQSVTVGGLDIDMAFDQCLPFLNHRSKTRVNVRRARIEVRSTNKNYLPQFVCGKIHSVEVGEDIASLHVFGDELELAERAFGVVIVLQVGQRNFKHATLESIGSNSCSLRAVH